MTTLRFDAFAGHVLEAESFGQQEWPTVLLLSALDDDASGKLAVQKALVQAGRQIVAVTLRHDAELSVHIADVRAVLAQLSARPIVLALSHAAEAAAQALRDQAVPLVGGFIAPSNAPDEAAPIGVPFLRADMDEASEEQWLPQIIAFLEAHQPSHPYEFREGSDTRTLRDAMGCFATGVTIVTTTDADGRAVGLTANSFTSVSLDPPLLLVCIANTTGSAPALRGADRFGVNVLQIGQQQESNRFASKAEDRFEGVDWAPGETGVPLLDHSLVSFECEREEMHEAGDHFILIGRVVRAQFEPHRDPLLFFRGKYRRMHFA